MTILYDEGQQAIATESRRVLEARVSKDALLPLLETVGEYHRPFWDTAKEQGWTALALPEADGGLGLGLIELGLIAHQAGRGISGAPFLTSSFGAAKAIELFGSDAQKARWLPGLASGETIGAIAFAAGPDALPRQPDVTFAGDRLEGTARSVSAGLAADVAVVLANGSDIPVLALVDLAGVQRSAVASFDNSRLIADLSFSGAPAEKLAAGGAARNGALHILALQAVVTAHEQTGGAEALMEIARDYALTRKAFGQPIGAFQSVKHRIAELYGLVELARANCIHAAAREGAADFIKAAAAARLSATDAYDTAARDCIQIHGGIGVTWEIGLHLHMRRARSLAIEQGSSLFWEDILVDRLAGEAA
ncbi:acyl-CoA dehydrogenase [Sphingopyxis sp. H038]|uniref:acyl-CoA dehydrogenase family protein n=1 Tax=unclassified Sphingopyxis TaxID=2614943 RepID=UPI00072FF797|nr:MULTISPECIES: acyl-CoA dehydrogenase family protein [unclassified Sphingopyxis]KTE02260.1 acyl-CoA dehydrogenase [Sphingopyxis sp. H012]KTE10009.1 acyl-CoA dehydrogenase [Sphingopyxis sp. H053]KTE15407.1 acyl-CoA dehydrogenase [Sphingopyxis sp. H093]KTE17911.1 acyl-CoA dehydrogenase [Sphingopyxis sp. H080]KTE33548.1 acyl-CoA dehydrogenase [Sphingopyxis sp. H038]